MIGNRTVLLGLFTAAGVGLALAVVFITQPPVPAGRASAGAVAGSAAGDLPQARRLKIPPNVIRGEPRPPETDGSASASAATTWFVPDSPAGAQPRWPASLFSAPATYRPATVPAGSPYAAAGPAAPSAPTQAKIHHAGEGDDQLVMHFRNDEIRQVLELLSEQGNLNILASDNVQGTISASLNGVDVESALDAILKATGYVARREGKFIYVGTPQDLQDMEQAIDTIGTRVYRPNYVTAAELQSLIQPLVTPEIGVVSVSSQAEAGIQSDSTTAGGDAFAGGDVVLVRDYEAVLAQIDQVVAEIDRRPLQVAIEAIILSVKLDDGYEFGVDFELLRNKEHLRFGWGTPLDSIAQFRFDKGGLKFGFLDGGLGAFLDALETIGDTNVIATPRLMVLNKQRAEILIGEQHGYVSTTITETSSSQSVEFLDVGAQLRLRPFISEDGLIRMEVHPELSTGSVDTESGFTLPNKETTQVTTNIMVPDGCTVVIGGLMREGLETTATQIPLLGNLPWIGVAFRNKSEKTQRREIIVLITPRIVSEPGFCLEGDGAAHEFLRRQATYADQMSPLGKRAIARRYVWLAQNAWAQGDRKRALRFAEMAVQFDPLSRTAIELRARIRQGMPFTPMPVGPHHVSGGPEEPFQGHIIDPWAPADRAAPLPDPKPPAEAGGQPAPGPSPERAPLPGPEIGES